MLENKNILITGITGQDGVLLARNLIAKGFNVSGIISDNNLARKIEIVKLFLNSNVNLKVLDSKNLLNFNEISVLIDELKPRYVFHLAADTDNISTGRNTDCYNKNFTFSKNLITSCVNLGSKVNFLFASSALIFEGSKDNVQDENTPMSPRSSYALAKADIMDLVYSGNICKNLIISTCILFPHESPIFERKFIFNKIINFARKIKYEPENAARLILGDISKIREWSAAEDFIDAFIAITEKNTSDIFIVGSGNGLSIAELIHKVSAISCIDLDKYIVLGDYNSSPCQAQSLVADPKKIHRQLGWKPKIFLDELIRAHIEYDGVSP